MRRKYLYLVICLVFFAMLIFPEIVKNVCAQGEKGKTTVESKTGNGSAEQKFSEEKNEFKRKTKERLDALDRKIKELEAESKKAGSKLTAEAKEGLRELKEKRVALKKDMKKLEAKSRERWEEIKRKVDAAIEDIEERYNKLRDKFKNE